LNLFFHHKKIGVLLYIILVFLMLSAKGLYANADNKMIHEVWSEQVKNKAEIFYRGKTGDFWDDAIQISALPGESVTPVVLSDDDGVIWIVWANIQDDESVLVYSVQKNGRWSEPKKINTGRKNNVAPCLVEDNNQNLWGFFSGNDGNDDDIFSMRWFDAGWNDFSRINNPNNTPDVLPYAAINDDGQLEVTWAGIKGGKYKIQTAIRSETSWVEVINPLKNKMNFSSDVENLRGREMSTYSEDYGVRPLSLQILHSIHNQKNALFNNIGKNSLTETNDPYANLLAKEYIITFGDSITWDEGGSAYRKELLRLLTQDGRDVQFYDWGSPSETTVEGLIRLDRFLGLVDADFLLLLEGTNDIRFGISYQTTISNLNLMLDKIIAAGVTPLISYLTPDGTSSEYNSQIVTIYNPGIKKLALQKNVTSVDNYTPLVQDWPAYSDDGLHPNESGYLVMGQTWFEALPEQNKSLDVQTGKASEIKSDEATLSALITPNGLETRYSFEYGIDGGGLNQVTEEFILEGDAPQTFVEITINDLSEETLYNYRAKAANDSEVKRGGILSFTTGDDGNDDGNEGGDDGGGGSGGCFIETLYR